MLGMSSPSLFLLGCGTCRIDPARGQTSACLIQGKTTFVVDLGFGSLERLERVGAFNQCSELHIHISHRHTDHLIGLFPLLQCLSWSDDYRYLRINKVVIHSTREVRELIEGIRSLWGPEETQLSKGCTPRSDRILEFAAGPDYEDWSYHVGGLEVRSVHLPSSNNHGVSFWLRGKRFAFTADATELNTSLIDFVKDADVCVFDFGHLSNVASGEGSYAITLDAIAELLAKGNPKKALAAHMYLRHLQNKILSAEERHSESERLIVATTELARPNGFMGTLESAKDFTDLLNSHGEESITTAKQNPNTSILE
jgi:ribonuclease BN (tRNA processing enzyme)